MRGRGSILFFFTLNGGSGTKSVVPRPNLFRSVIKLILAALLDEQSKAAAKQKRSRGGLPDSDRAKKQMQF